MHVCTRNDILKQWTRHLHYVNTLDENTLQEQTTFKNEREAIDSYSNVFVAYFVTSYTRLEQYRGIITVGLERVICGDTDCIIASDGPGWLTLQI